MHVEVRFFAAAREAAGCASEQVHVAEGDTVAALWSRLASKHPALASLAPSLRFAVGERFAPPETELSGGDTVAILPPVSGG